MQNEAPQFMLVAYFQQGGIAMYPLLLCSILTFAIVIERIITYGRSGRADSALRPVLHKLLSEGRDVATAAARCSEGASPLARTAQVALAAHLGGSGARAKALERAVTRETTELERYLPVLATIGSVSPFIGLFGTVLGIMRAFRDIGVAGTAGQAVVASGIAEALITTASGLFVAVVAVVAYNHLMTWAQSIITTTELDSEELASLLDE
jgi:biopolymer transport protein ExbB